MTGSPTRRADAPETAPRRSPHRGTVPGVEPSGPSCQQLPLPWPSHQTSMPLGRAAPDLSLPSTLPAYRLWWEVSVCFDQASSPRMKAGTALRKKPARSCP